MTTLKRIAALSLFALAAAACGSDSTPAAPAKPTLGTQIDRMGRPAVNTALSNPFELLAGTADAAKDAYNASADPTACVGSRIPMRTKRPTRYWAAESFASG